MSARRAHGHVYNWLRYILDISDIVSHGFIIGLYDGRLERFPNGAEKETASEKATPTGAFEQAAEGGTQPT